MIGIIIFGGACIFVFYGTVYALLHIHDKIKNSWGRRVLVPYGIFKKEDFK